MYICTISHNIHIRLAPRVRESSCSLSSISTKFTMLNLAVGAGSTWRFSEKTLKSVGYQVERLRFANWECV